MSKKRPDGDGTIRKRSDGRWEGRVVIGCDDKGLPKTKGITAKSKAVCLKKLEKLKTECGIVTGKARPDMPFGDWLDLWYKTYSKPLCASQRSFATRIESVSISSRRSVRSR